MVISLGDTSFRPIIEPDQERAHNKLQFITETRLKLEVTEAKGLFDLSNVKGSWDNPQRLFVHNFRLVLARKTKF